MQLRSSSIQRRRTRSIGNHDLNVAFLSTNPRPSQLLVGGDLKCNVVVLHSCYLLYGSIEVVVLKTRLFEEMDQLGKVGANIDKARY